MGAGPRSGPVSCPRGAAEDSRGPWEGEGGHETVGEMAGRRQGEWEDRPGGEPLGGASWRRGLCRQPAPAALDALTAAPPPHARRCVLREAPLYTRPGSFLPTRCLFTHPLTCPPICPSIHCFLKTHCVFGSPTPDQVLAHLGSCLLRPFPSHPWCFTGTPAQLVSPF